VHQVAHEIAPDTRVVYVDNDPIVLAHARALMPMTDRVNPAAVAVVEGDLRRPDTITNLLSNSSLLDPNAPTAVLLLAMLMSLTDDEMPYDVVAKLLDPLPSGSYLAATHTTADLDPLAMNGYVKAAHSTGLKFIPRSKTEIDRFFQGLELVPPGVVPVLAWRPDALTEPDPRSVYIYAGLGRVP
jgi:O-methyltransferase involved in polyketide biosynthesis